MASTPTVSGDILAKYEPVIGLEVHVQLLTASKIFCSCSTRFGDSPNTNVCPVCLGLPGALPVLNRKAVEFAALAAMALECRVNRVSIFARKNYFYPDLPKGYQISQYDKPLAEFGFIDIDVNGGKKKIGITRLHLEEDAGKSLHEGFADSAHKTAIDLNRTGVPLAEIVSEPDMRSAEEAYEYLTRLKEIILYTGVSDCNMEEGSLRCDANISVRPRGRRNLGRRRKLRTSIRFASSSRRWSMKSSGTSKSSNRAARSRRNRGSITHTKAGLTVCARKSRRTTTGIFQSRICFRWWWMKNGKLRFARVCRSFPKRAASA